VLRRRSGICGSHSQKEFVVSQFRRIDPPSQVDDSAIVINGEQSIRSIAGFNCVENASAVHGMRVTFLGTIFIFRLEVQGKSLTVNKRKQVAGYFDD
jgi:hypothetical protein